MLDVIAYLDPGTGSIILQAIVGGALAVIFVVRTKLRLWLGKVRDVFGGKKDHAEQQTAKDK
jgi:hypothetical protein